MDERKIRIFFCCEDDLKVKGVNERDGKKCWKLVAEVAVIQVVEAIKNLDKNSGRRIIRYTINSSLGNMDEFFFSYLE